MRIVDLFCGIGGVAEATRSLTGSGLQGLSSPDGKASSPVVVAAIDIDLRVQEIYAVNHGVEPMNRAIESIRNVPEADVWWLSPPCQPYTKRGRGLAENDSRSLGMARIIELLENVRPKGIMLENVPVFSGSPHHRSLEAILNAAGYSVQADWFCPTQWGVPMRRERFYLRARRDGDPILAVEHDGLQQSISDFVEDSAWSDDGLRVSTRDQEKFLKAMNVLDAADDRAIAACFTSAYGKSPVQAGSYLYCRRRRLLRRFSPTEIGRLMGYREDYWWPDGISQRVQYQLLGNALSVTVVRALLQTMLDL